MLVYLIPIIITIFCGIRYDYNNKDKGKNIWIFFLYIYLILIIGLRYKVGGDTINYMGDYEWRVPISQWQISWLDNFQPGYSFLCSVSKSISTDFFIFQLIHSLLLNTLLFYFIYINTKYFFFSLLTIFLTCYLYFSTEILREALAVLIFALNYNNLVKKKWLKYYLGVCLCCFFHLSAIFLLIIPFFSNLKFNIVYWLLIISIVVLNAVLLGILERISSIQIFMKLNNYIDETSYGLMADTLRLIRSFLIPILYMSMVRYGLKREIKFESMVILFSLFGFAGFFNPIIFGRLTNYFILFFSLSVGSFCGEMLKKRKRVLNEYAQILIIMLICAYGSEYIVYNRYTLWYPYSSILNPREISREYANKMLLNR